jgi:hypothetical protein
MILCGGAGTVTLRSKASRIVIGAATAAPSRPSAQAIATAASARIEHRAKVPRSARDDNIFFIDASSQRKPVAERGPLHSA